MSYNKYGNKKVKLDGYTFDSKRESLYYLKYKRQQIDGKISELTLQPSYVLQDKFRDRDGVAHRAISYKADFRFIKDGEIVVIDVKGFKTEIYKLKKKMFLFKYPDIVFREVY